MWFTDIFVSLDVLFKKHIMICHARIFADIARGSFWLDNNVQYVAFKYACENNNLTHWSVDHNNTDTTDYNMQVISR